MVTIADIERARQTISGQALRTPLLPAPPLSALTGAEVFVKYENLQVTNSFKERGDTVITGDATSLDMALELEENLLCPLLRSPNA
jgi:threonine dehydratase